MYVRTHLVERGPELQLVPKKCLVILPQYSLAEPFFDQVIRPVLEAPPLELFCILGKELFNPANTAAEAIEDILTSEFIVADISGRDPQVMYHLGQALVFRDEALLISRSPNDCPFNFAEYAVLPYDFTHNQLVELQQALMERFKAVLEVDGDEFEPTDSFPFLDDLTQPETVTGTNFAGAAGALSGAIPMPGANPNPFIDASSPLPGNYAAAGAEYMPTQALDEGNPFAGGSTGEGTLNVDVAYKKGVEYRTLGMYSEAVQEFLKILDVKPDSSQLYNLVADTYQEMGDHNRAIDAYTQAVNLDPDNFNAYNGLGISYARKKMHYEAINAYADAIRINPDDPSVLSNLGASYNALGMYDDALEAYEKALALDPGSSKIYLNLGNTFFNKAMYPDAITAYEKALKANPEYEKARRNLDKAIRKQQESSDSQL